MSTEATTSQHLFDVIAYASLFLTMIANDLDFQPSTIFPKLLPIHFVGKGADGGVDQEAHQGVDQGITRESVTKEMIEGAWGIPTGSSHLAIKIFGFLDL